MARADPETLLQRAREKAPVGRNNAGFWLAQQLHANGYTESEAEAVMRRFVVSVGGGDRGGYTSMEAMATLKAEYKRPAKEPWRTGAGSQRSRQTKEAFPTAPPQKRESEIPSESLSLFHEQCKGMQPFADSPAEAYLLSRGIPSELAQAARCRYHPTWGRTSGGSAGIGPAVIFPFYGEDGQSVAGSGRAIRGDVPSRLKSRTYGPKSAGIFFTPGALDADPVAITEAPIDALSLSLAGLPSFAVGGCSGLPAWLVKKLGLPSMNTPAGYSRKVYLAFDNDPAGEQAAARIGANLPLMRTIRLRPDRKDWNEDLVQDGLDALREWLIDPGFLERGLTTGETASIRREVIREGNESLFSELVSESPSSAVSVDSEIAAHSRPGKSCRYCGANNWRFEPCAFDGAGGYICLACKRASRI